MTGPPRLTLSGYYGFGNAGDEAVLAGLVLALQAARPSGPPRLTALSMRPAETEAAHGVGAAHRYRPAALLGALARTDLLLSGGGSLLQDVTSAHGLFYYLSVVRLAQILGRKTMFVAQGIGPLRLARSRRLVASVANRLDLVTVRDPGSAALLREIGVTRPPLEVTADPALLLAPPRTLALDNAWFGVALRPWGDRSAADLVARACARALAGQQALVISMQPQQDEPVSEQFAAVWHQQNSGQATRLSLARPGTALVPLEPLMENLAACRLVVGMRLHALILAAACGVPAVALAYDPKVTAFMEDSGQGDAVFDLTHPDPDALARLLARVWAERDDRSRALQTRLPELRAAAARNGTLALSLLDQQRKQGI